MKKLIIWDFDGVVADTEKLWLKVELEVFNRYCGINWDFQTINHYLAGQSFSHQLEVLHSLGIYPPKEAMEEIDEKCFEIIANGFDKTEGIDDVLSLDGFENALGTGGDMVETKLKLKAIGLEDVFTDKNVVTIDFVERGKPAPDTFLLAAKIMGYEPKDCIVIEDAIAGLTAAQNAGMLPICFAGSEMYRDNEIHLNSVRELGVKHIFKTMSELKDFLINI